MTCPEESYTSVLVTRYCRSSPLLKTFSEKNKTILWRQLWIWLAEAELELGLKQITQEAVDELKANRDNIDWPLVRAEERRLKHDVMAHNHTYGKICPKAAGIIHLGATSCYVQDNADLICIREAVDHILRRVAIVLHRIGVFADKHKDTVTVGRTHYQTASLVTVGKRAVIWAQELVLAFKQIEHFRETIKFRGVKGATGTQDSFLTLFQGDEDKVEQLDELVTKKAGFSQRFFITGQTYSRQQDAHLSFGLAALGAAIKKISTDIRILQAFDELLEPFEKDQIGSSAMPYKKNPMKDERCCSIVRALQQLPAEALSILSDQGLERTLDDSAGRRRWIPEGFLLADAALDVLQNIFEGLTVQRENVDDLVARELPFLGLEKAMMYLTEEGVDRQQAHSVIRETALAAKQRQKKHSVDMAEMLHDPFFDKVRDRVLALVSKPLSFTGRCVTQTTRFIKEEIDPIVSKYVREEDLKKWLGRPNLGSVFMPFGPRGQCLYTSCYCEENILKLCARIPADRHDAFFVVFLSNVERAFPIFEQKACREDRDYVIWDYHVILVEKADSVSKVYDLDTRLDFPCPFTEYCEESFPSEWKFPPECARKFRILPVAVYLEHFSSDRRHMRKADNTWNSPPPSWEPNFRVELGHNLDEFIRMDADSAVSHVSTVLDEEAFYGYFL
ncbi:unnamed protein product, partial [Mesorhabditis spiculigera]